MSKKVPPLKSRTMTLHQLQLATLDLIRHMRFQLSRQAHEDGTSDSEFIDEFLVPFENKIYQDRDVLRRRRREKSDKTRGEEKG